MEGKEEKRGRETNVPPPQRRAGVRSRSSALSPPPTRWPFRVPAPLLYNLDEKSLDLAELESHTIAQIPKRNRTPRPGSTPIAETVWPATFRPAPADSSGTRLQFTPEGIRGERFSSEWGQGRSPGGSPPSFEFEHEEVDPGLLLSTDYLRSPVLSQRNFPAEWKTDIVDFNNPVDLARLEMLNEADYTMAVNIAGNKKRLTVTYPSLAFLQDGSMVSILYGGSGKLYVASLGPIGKKYKPGEPVDRTLTIADPKAAYRMNFKELPIYLERGDATTALTRQKIDDMEPNTILNDWEHIYDRDLKYPEYIEQLRTRGSAYVNNETNFRTGPLLGQIVGSFLKIR